MKCTKQNCQGFDSCMEYKYYETGECEKKKVFGKIDASVPDSTCKKCCYIQSMCYCTFMRADSLYEDNKAFEPECRKEEMNIVQAGCVFILRDHLGEMI